MVMDNEAVRVEVSFSPVIVEDCINIWRGYL